MQREAEEYTVKNKIQFIVQETENFEIGKRLISLDRAIFGKIVHITDKESYWREV